jgi:flagellar operon protein
MSDTIVNGVKVPFIPVGGVAREQVRLPIELNDERSFNTILEKELTQLKYSKHAQQRLESRNMELNDADRSKIEHAVNRAEQKGSNDSLVFLRDMAFIVNIKNRTVVTAIDRENLRENVFTNIDSAVVAE